MTSEETSQDLAHRAFSSKMFEDAANPFDHDSQPDEPAKGTVLAYQRAGAGGRVLDYVSFRAGDGKWYTTGRTGQNGVTWTRFWESLMTHRVLSLKIATAWSDLSLPSYPIEFFVVRPGSPAPSTRRLMRKFADDDFFEDDER